MKQDIIDYLKDKSILVLGYGREGKSAVEFIQQNLPGADFAVAARDELLIDNVHTYWGDDYLDACKEYDGRTRGSETEAEALH